MISVIAAKSSGIAIVVAGHAENVAVGGGGWVSRAGVDHARVVRSRPDIVGLASR